MQPDMLLPEETRLGPVALRVRDIAAALPVWRDVIGLQVLAPDAKEDQRRDQGQVTLGIGGRALVQLHPGAGAPVPGPVVGLFHVAVHVSALADLAQVLARMRASGRRHSGQDHQNSKSLYVSDTDGNGIEVALDTPGRGKVAIVDGKPHAHTNDGRPHTLLESLDIDELLALLPEGTAPQPVLPAASLVGHIHFRTNDRDRVFSFYRDEIGLRPNINLASFQFCDLGTPLRHHMVAFNTWGGANLAAAPRGAPGLVSATIVVPHSAALAEVAVRLAKTRVAFTDKDRSIHCADPDGSPIRLITGNA